MDSNSRDSDMAIVCSDQNFYLLDDLKYYGELYKDLGLCYKRELYEIPEPFLMQSRVNSINAMILSKGGTNPDRKIRKRKKKAPKSIPDENGRFVEDSFQEIISKCQSSGFLKLDFPVDQLLTGNKIARDTLKSVTDRLNSDHPYFISNISSEKYDSIVDHSEITDFYGRNYILPGCSSFIQSDVIEGLNLIARNKLKFDMIIMDPPWTNKSVRRKRSYETEPENYLLRVPLRDILKTDSIIAIWVTNNRRLQRFVEESLAEKWRLKLIAIYFWVKVTTNGQPVYDFNPDYKMPFEPLYIFRYNPDGAAATPAQMSKKFLYSVPCVVPSRKLPLMEVLHRDFGASTSDIHFLELFARNLQKNTTSIGDQVLFMQDENWFE